MPGVNRPEIIDELALKFNISKAKMANILDAYQEVIMAEVSQGKTVKITGFAAFEPSKKAARNIVNPKTGETESYPERNSVRIRPLLKFNEILKTMKEDSL